MTSKPKLLFVYDHPNPENWLDGLSAALHLLENDFEVERFNLRYYPHSLNPEEYDFALGWGAFGSPVDDILKSKKHPSGTTWKKKGLCIAGNAMPPEGMLNYDILFYETEWYQPTIAAHPKTVRAFGVNTDIFSPPPINVPIVWDYIGVGAFASWKRWHLFKDRVGSRLVVGQYQENNLEESRGIADFLIRHGVMVSNEVTPLELLNLYYWSRTLYIPADVNGGGERAILEARACGLGIETEDDNPKLRELLTGEIPSHHDYARALKDGIASVL